MEGSIWARTPRTARDRVCHDTMTAILSTRRFMSSTKYTAYSLFQRSFKVCSPDPPIRRLPGVRDGVTTPGLPSLLLSSINQIYPPRAHAASAISLPPPWGMLPPSRPSLCGGRSCMLPCSSFTSIYDYDTFPAPPLPDSPFGGFYVPCIAVACTSSSTRPAKNMVFTPVFNTVHDAR